MSSNTQGSAPAPSFNSDPAKSTDNSEEVEEGPLGTFPKESLRKVKQLTDDYNALRASTPSDKWEEHFTRPTIKKPSDIEAEEQAMREEAMREEQERAYQIQKAEEEKERARQVQKTDEVLREFIARLSR
jgi:hypothetical protein